MTSERPPYRWPEGKACAVVFSADVDGESPYLWANRGRALVGLAELEQRRFGPREGLYRILDLLDAFALPGSFYVPGYVADTYPEVLPAILERGHEIGLHGYHHERIEQLSEAENEAVLDRSIKVFRRRVGAEPKAYRSPAWEMTPALLRLLRDRNFAYDSSLMGYDHPYSLDGLTEVPVQWLVDDAIYFRFSGGGKDHWHPAAPDAVLGSWIEEFEGVREFGGLFTITVHPWISGRAQRIRLLRRLFEHISSHDDVWWASAGQVAAHHAGSANFAAFDVPAALASTDF